MLNLIWVINGAPSTKCILWSQFDLSYLLLIGLIVALAWNWLFTIHARFAELLAHVSPTTSRVVPTSDRTVLGRKHVVEPFNVRIGPTAWARARERVTKMPYQCYWNKRSSCVRTTNHIRPKVTMFRRIVLANVPVNFGVRVFFFSSRGFRVSMGERKSDKKYKRDPKTEVVFVYDDCFIVLIHK